MTVNPYYDKLVKTMTSGKDSVFEPCKIISFDSATLTAEVYFIKSRQSRKDAIVLFPSLFLNTGIISFPVPNATALAFWGDQRQVYIVPAQFTMPVNEVTSGMVKQNASPARVDTTFDLSHLAPGETLIRSLAGSYFYVNNAGSAEMGTASMHRVGITDDGVHYINAEELSIQTPTWEHTQEWVDTTGGKRCVQKIVIREQLPTISGIEALQDSSNLQGMTEQTSAALSLLEQIEEVPADPIAEIRIGAISSSNEESRLIFECLFKNSLLSIAEDGRCSYTVGSGNREQGLSVHAGGVDVIVDGVSYSLSDIVRGMNK